MAKNGIGPRLTRDEADRLAEDDVHHHVAHLVADEAGGGAEREPGVVAEVAEVGLGPLERLVRTRARGARRPRASGTTRARDAPPVQRRLSRRRCASRRRGARAPLRDTARGRPPAAGRASQAAASRSPSRRHFSSHDGSPNFGTGTPPARPPPTSNTTDTIAHPTTARMCFRLLPSRDCDTRNAPASGARDLRVGCGGVGCAAPRA